MPRRNLIWLVVILAAAAITVRLTWPQPRPSQRATAHPFYNVGEALKKIENNYYLSLDRTQALRGAVCGVVGELDEFSSYIPAQQVEAFKSRMVGITHGLGLTVLQADGSIEVDTVLYDSPAGRAGIRPGDRLVSVDSQDAAGMSLKDIHSCLSVELGKSVQLVVLTLAGKTRSVKLTSRQLHIETVTGLYRLPMGQWSWMLDNEQAIAYIRIREFVNDTAERFQVAYRPLVGIAKGIVLDLRGNPGGRCELAIQIADMFLKEGLIVKTIGRKGKIDYHHAHLQGTLADIPVVVLIDEDSASGAELLAGALWANDRAVLVGARTRGKGCIQSMIELGRGGMVNLTTSRFLLARPRAITRFKGSSVWGIDPNEVVQIDPACKRRLCRMIAEAEVPAGEVDKKSALPQCPRIVQQMLELDAQLARGYELLCEPEKIRAILARQVEQADE